LKYKHGMRVLNIVSGEKMPAYGSGGHKVDFEAWVRRARELGLGKMMGGIPGGGGGGANGEQERRVDSGMHLGGSFGNGRVEDGDGTDDDDQGGITRSRSRIAEVRA
jgi:hypothetical protein